MIEGGRMAAPAATAPDPAASAIVAPGYRFGEFRLYPGLRLLLRGDDKVEIGQTTFNFAAFLLENTGRQIHRDEIVAAVWRRKIIGNSTFANHVVAFRSLFGEDSLITINMLGYQCALLVERIDAPPPELLPVPPPPSIHHLPRRAALAIGRVGELVQAAAVLDASRLLTVLGPGGIGKTWLAVELGWRLADAFPGGVHLVALAPVREAPGIAIAIAKTLGISLHGIRPPVDIIVQALRSRPKLLLIFDSCDYVAGETGQLIEILRPLPQLSMLATSQQRLGLADETVLRLGPLALDEAARLFVEHIRAVDPGFAPDPAKAAAIAEICRRLDAIPLAVELAGARARTLDVEAVRQGLARDERFRMLGNGPAGAANRQQTLLAAVHWSHGLLTPADQAVFRRLACFAGSFSRDAAVALAGTGEAGRWDVIDALDRLVDRSLLEFEGENRQRYRLLETLRIFGALQLAAQGEGEALAERMVGYFIGVFEQAEAEWQTTPDGEWLRLYRGEIDNIRAGLDWALAQPGRLAQGVALSGASARLWYMRDLVPEGRQYCDRFIARLDDSVPPTVAARLLRYCGILWRNADRLRAVELMERAAAIYRQIDDRAGLGTVLGLIGGDSVYLGRHADAKSYLDEAQKLLSGGPQMKSQVGILTDLGVLAVATDKLEEARRHHMAALDLARRVPDMIRENIALINLGEVEFRLGATHQAIERAREAASTFRAAELTAHLAPALTNVTTYQAVTGDTNGARRHGKEALLILANQGGYWLRLCLEAWALIAALEGRYSEAALLKGFADADYCRAGEIREPVEKLVDERISRICAEHLPSDSIADFLADGASWTPERAVDFALRRIVSPET